MSDSGLTLVVLALFSIVSLLILHKCGLLKLSESKGENTAKLALMSPLIGFLLFLAACAFVPGWVAKLIHYTDTHGFSSFSNAEQVGLSQLIALAIAAFLLVGFSRIHPEEIRGKIWGPVSTKAIAKAFFKGVLYCILTYPIVMVSVQGIHLFLEWLGQKPCQEQVAIYQLKALRNCPWLFWSLTAAVVSLVPLIEEFLFRGLCQNYLGGFLGPKFAVILTSILFALFHYSQEQGSTNYELMVGLLLFSYFMGMFYIKERSLWTSIAMHATFNSITLFFMIYILP